MININKFITKNTKVEKSSEIGEFLFGQKIVNIARKYLDHPYDTSPNGFDGGALKQWKQKGSTEILNNFTGKKETAEKEPLVCTDLIVKTLEELDLKKYLKLNVVNNKENWRKTATLEKIMEESEYFEVIDCNIEVSYLNHSKLNSLPSCFVGDIITSSSTDHQGRHISIVTSVDSEGFPLTAIHSVGHKGVVETTFFNILKIPDYKQRDRYSGSLSGNAVINKIIRPTKQAILKTLGK